MRKTISLDLDAYEILKEFKKRMKEKGIRADFSDVIRYMKKVIENGTDS
ncbi:MAG: hypothetical protein QXQ24_05555 [Nitrososphaeria archaeon]